MFSLPPEILANWLQPGALVAGAVGGMGLLIGAFRHLGSDLKGEMREMKEEMEIKTLLIQALRLPPPAQP